jgi:4a-hydroxytetrahydrobiopterin dehydratase
MLELTNDHYMRILTKDEIKENLKYIDKWKYKRNSIVKRLKVKNFMTAIKLVNTIAPIAEKLEHHPDIEIKNYNEVVIKLTTHDAKGITKYDFELAKKIDKAIKDFSNTKPI